jgi:hypothetical protein
MSQYNFGAGAMYGIVAGTPPMVSKFGTLQEVSIDFSGSIKSLFGQNMFADTAAQGQKKVTGKAKFGRINAQTYNNLYFNQTISTGMTLVAQNEVGTVPTATPWQVTVANAATWTEDLGVVYALTGLPLKRVIAVTAAGQYSVVAGVYTFYTGDALAAVYIDYEYTSATLGNTISINNALIGVANTWRSVFNGVFNGKQTTMILNACVSSKLSLISTKVEDFVVPEIDFEAFCDSGGCLGKYSSVE